MQPTPRRIIIVGYWLALIVFTAITLSRAVSQVSDGADSLLLLFAAGLPALGFLMGIHLATFWRRSFTFREVMRVVWPLDPMTR